MTINVGSLYRDKLEEVYGACDGTYEERFENAARKLEELRKTNGVEGEIVRVGEDLVIVLVTALMKRTPTLR